MEQELEIDYTQDFTSGDLRLLECQMKQFFPRIVCKGTYC